VVATKHRDIYYMFFTSASLIDNLGLSVDVSTNCLETVTREKLRSTVTIWSNLGAFNDGASAAVLTM
jgi:hypothetical protein